MRVNYVYKKESERKYFSATDSLTELKEYIDDLIFYTPAQNTFRAERSLGNPVMRYGTKPEIFTGGPFGTYYKITEPVSFDRNNFDSLSGNARISFYLGTNVVNEAPQVTLTLKNEYAESGIPAGNYSLTVTVDGQPTSTMTLSLPYDGNTVSTIKNRLLFKLDPTVYPFGINAANTEQDKIVLQSSIPGRTLHVTDGLDGTSLLDYFDIDGSEYGSSPAESVDFLKLFNLTLSHFKNTEAGSAKSCIKIRLGKLLDDGTFSDSDENAQEIIVPWNSDSIHLDNIEIDFDENLIYVFINGELVKIEILRNKFAQTQQTLELCGLEYAPYSFDEIIINNRHIHTKDFTPDTEQLTKYTKKIPYIDYYFAGSELKNNMALETLRQQGIHCCVNDGGNYYYYNAGAWRHGDGTYSSSNDWSTFSEKIKTFEYSGGDIFIRAFFFSNGTEPAFLDVPYFFVDDETYEDESGNTAAILIGSKEWTDDNGDPLVEDMYDKELTIRTDQGEQTITFLPDDDTELTFPMTIEEVMEYIWKRYPDGISQAIPDSKARAVLVSETKGEDAYIIVDGSAAPIIFGENFVAKGMDPSKNEVPYDKFCQDIRTYTGEPLITMEISNEQIKMYLKEALYYYKKWKGDKINQYTCQLKGNWHDGYEIPKVIEDQKDIVDILFKPVFPITFYGSDLIADGDENIFTLTLAQTIFGGRGGRHGEGVQQDFYVSLMGMQDFKQTFGLNPSWEILNGRIYIFPSQVTRFTNVCIKYKAPLSEEEALNDAEVRKYVFARCCLALGMIRGQFGSNLSVGEAALTFNSEALMQMGREMMKEVLDSWKEQQPPLGFFFG